MNRTIQNQNTYDLSSEQLRYLNILVTKSLNGERVNTIHISSLNVCIGFRKYITDYVCNNHMLSIKEINRLDTLIHLLQEKELTIELSNKEIITLDCELNSRRVIWMRIIKYVNLILLFILFVFFICSVLQFNNIVNQILGLVVVVLVLFAMLNIVIGRTYTENGKGIKAD